MQNNSLQNNNNNQINNYNFTNGQNIQYNVQNQQNQYNQLNQQNQNNQQNTFSRTPPTLSPRFNTNQLPVIRIMTPPPGQSSSLVQYSNNNYTNSPLNSNRQYPPKTLPPLQQKASLPN